MEEDKKSFECEVCGSIMETSRLCSKCGTIYADNIFCKNHLEVKADGFCLVCGTLCCGNCGAYNNRCFLCNEHKEYEIIEGMCCVYETRNSMESDEFNAILEAEGLHPFIYSVGNYDPYSGAQSTFFTSFFKPGREATVIKIMLPPNETLKGEKILEEVISSIEKDGENQQEEEE